MSGRERWWLRAGGTPWAPVPPGNQPEETTGSGGRRPPGLDFVGRRVVGVLFLTPALLALGLLRTAAYGLQLTFRPERARERLFRLSEPWRQAARFAWYEDFRVLHAVGAGATAGGYWWLWRWALGPGG